MHRAAPTSPSVAKKTRRPEDRVGRGVYLRGSFSAIAEGRMSNFDPLLKPPDLSDGDFDLIERFVTAFNRVDRYLREVYHADERLSFGRLVEIHLRKNPHWRDADALRAFKAVRNVMIHERELPYRYLFVPTQSAVAEMERIADHLIRPERLIPRFNRHVWTVGLDDTVAKLFQQIDARHCTKFPVYKDERFQGLVTENGVTRWLARYSAAAGPTIDVREATVAAILSEEEDHRNVEFMAASASTDDLVRSFSRNAALQAVLITAEGNADERLLGIATWGDALQLIGE